MDTVPPQGEGKPNQIVCDADAAHEMHEMDCGQSSDETLQGGARKRKTNVDLATNLAESEDNDQPTTVSEKHRQLRSILATLLAEEYQENLITKILGLLTEITAKKKTSRKRSKTLKETETAKDSPTSNAKPSATPTQESLAKTVSAPRQQENDATPPEEQQPLRQPQPRGKDTTQGGQDENAADNDDDGFIKVTNKRKRPRREPQPDTQKPNEHLKEVRIRPKSKTPMGEWKLEILGYLEKTLEIKRKDITLKYFPKSNTISVRTDSKEVLQKIMENYTYENAKGEKIEVSTYQAYWKKHTKGVIYDADITGEAESLINLVDSKQLPVVAARRMGNTKTVAITFEGEKLPRSILFNRYHAPLYPFKPKTIVCANCHRTGHKPDICVQDPVCARCGRTHPREGMDTDTSESECPDPKTYCQQCKKEGHLATDKNCATRIENNRKMRASIQAMKAQSRSSQIGARIDPVPDPSSNQTAAPAAPTATPQTTVPDKNPSPTSLASSYANVLCRSLAEAENQSIRGELQALKGTLQAFVVQQEQWRVQLQQQQQMLQQMQQQQQQTQNFIQKFFGGALIPVDDQGRAVELPRAPTSGGGAQRAVSCKITRSSGRSADAGN
ncbi:hypothetical protein ISCGN_016841 [Ixodes scapularis]